MADLAGDEDVREEVHLDLHKSVAAAGLAAAALGIEREPARAVAARARVCRRGEQVADVVEDTGVGRGIGARHAADGALVDADDLVEVLQALNAVEFPRPRAGTVEATGELFIEDLVDEARFARAGHAGHAGEGAERELDVDVAQVIFRRAENFQGFSVARPPLFGQGDLLRAGQILARNGARGGDDVVDGARGDDLAAVHARAGADVDDEVGGAHGILVMLDDEHGVADVAQAAKGVEQLVVVALVQADGRLVQDIQDADEARADLRGQADALALAAGERRGRARERQVAQAHGLQKRQPGADLPHDLLGDDSHGAGELQTVDEFQFLRDRQRAEVHDVHPADGDGEADVGQALAVALGAGALGHALLELLAHGVGLCLGEAAGDVVDHALERPLERAAPVGALIIDGELFRARAVEDDVERLLRQRLDGVVQREMIFLGQRLKIHPGDGIVAHVVPAGGLDGALQDGLRAVGDDEQRVGHLLCAETRADGAGPVGIVEREHARGQLRHGDAAVLAGVVLGEEGILVPFELIEDDKTAGQVRRRLDRVSQAAGQIRLHDEPVDHDLDVVLLVLVERDLLRQLIQAPVHAHAGVAAAAGVVEHLLVLALFAAHDGGEDLKFCPLRQAHDLVDDLVDRLAADLLAAFRAVRRAAAGP